MPKHVMVDLETLSSRPDAVVISIGACTFDPATGRIVDPPLHLAVDPTSQPRRHVDPRTVAWWSQQSEEARKLLPLCVEQGMHVGDALNRFSGWFPKGGYFWCHATFDAVVLQSAYDGLQLKAPWTHRSVRDIRTIVALARATGLRIEKDRGREGVHHDALDDARYQAAYVSRTWKHLTSPFQAQEDQR